MIPNNVDVLFFDNVDGVASYCIDDDELPLPPQAPGSASTPIFQEHLIFQALDILLCVF